MWNWFFFFLKKAEHMKTLRFGQIMTWGFQTPATSWWRMMHGISCASFPGIWTAQVSILLKYIQVSCTLQALAAQFFPHHLGKQPCLFWYTDSGHQQALAKSLVKDCDNPAVLWPSHRGLSQIMELSASSSFILFNNHLQSTYSVPETISSPY